MRPFSPGSPPGTPESGLEVPASSPGWVTTPDKRGLHVGRAATQGGGPLVPGRNTTRDEVTFFFFFRFRVSY